MSIARKVIWLSLMIACGENERTAELEPLSQREVLAKTVRTPDDWVVPKTSLIPEVEHEDPRLIEAERLFQNEEGLKAAELLLSVVQKEPDLVAAHSLLSAVLIQLGDVVQATTAATKVVDLAPSAWSYCNLGTVYILREEFEFAKEAFHKALDINPKYFLAYRNLGSLAYQNQEYAEAEEYFQQFIRLDPEDTYSYVAYGQVLAEQGKFDAAIEVYLYRLQELEWDEESVKRTPSGLTLDLPLALAEVYRRQGKTDQAIEWFLQTIEWSWVYKGHWTSETSYANKSYQRLAKLLNALPQYERNSRLIKIEAWFSIKRTLIPTMEQEIEEGRYAEWLQSVAVDVGP